MPAVRLGQEGGEFLEVPLEVRLVERDLGQLEEMVLEVVEVPENRLPVEGGAGVGQRVVHDAAAQDLEAR